MTRELLFSTYRNGSLRDDDPNPELESVDPEADRAYGSDRGPGVQRRIRLDQPDPVDAGRKRRAQRSLAVHQDRRHPHRLYQEARLSERVAVQVPF